MKKIFFLNGKAENLFLLITILGLFASNVFLLSEPKRSKAKISPQQLIQNLNTGIYTGDKVDTIRLNKAPVRNLFTTKFYGIEPLFKKYSGLKWEVEKNCNIKISLKYENIPWDKVLSEVLRDNKLEIILKKGVLFVKKSTKKLKTRKDKKTESAKIPIKYKIDVNTLSEINRPEYIKIFKDYIYISDSVKIKVFSLKDFKFKGVIGKSGQGPGEFQPYPFVENMGKLSFFFSGDKVIIGSRNKVSYFNLDFRFDKEKRMANPMAYHLTPFGDGYAGIEVIRTSKWSYVFNIYNNYGELKKRICSYQKNIHTSGVKKSGLGMVFLSRLLKGPEYIINKNRLYVSGADGFSLDIYDQHGDMIKKIKYKYKKHKISKKDHKKIIDVYKNSGGRSYWKMAKNIIKIPEFYPEFSSFRIDQDIIYFQTYRKKNNKTEFILFSIDGKYLKTIYIPLKYKDFITPYPYTIYKNNVYRFVENDEGDWVLDRVMISIDQVK